MRFGQSVIAAATLTWVLRRMLFKTRIMPVFNAPDYARLILGIMLNYARGMQLCPKLRAQKLAFLAENIVVNATENVALPAEMA